MTKKIFSSFVNVNNVDKSICFKKFICFKIVNFLKNNLDLFKKESKLGSNKKSIEDRRRI